MGRSATYEEIIEQSIITMNSMTKKLGSKEAGAAYATACAIIHNPTLMKTPIEIFNDLMKTKGD